MNRKLTITQEFNMNRTRMHWQVALLLALTLLTGCAAHQRGDFGDAVRHMKREQLANPAALYPDPEPVTQSDGHRVEGVLDAYRQETARREEMPREVIIGVAR
jgi:hypothetical protein